MKTLIFALLMVLCSGCVTDMKSPQYVDRFSIAEDEIDHVKSASMDAANALGFSESAQASVSDALAAAGKFQLLYKSERDSSFIVINNVANAGCIEIGVYSVDGASRATEIGAAVKSRLKSDDKEEGKCD